LEELHTSDAKLSILSRPIKEVPPRATAFATEMTNLNIWGQTALMISRLQDKKEHFTALAAAANKAVSDIDMEIQSLAAERSELKEAERNYNMMLAQVKSRTAARDQLHGENAVLRKSKGVARTAANKNIFRSHLQGIARSYSHLMIQELLLNKVKAFPTPLPHSQARLRMSLSHCLKNANVRIGNNWILSRKKI
jgi:hypothetical protein